VKVIVEAYQFILFLYYAATTPVRNGLLIIEDS